MATNSAKSVSPAIVKAISNLLALPLDKLKC